MNLFTKIIIAIALSIFSLSSSAQNTRKTRAKRKATVELNEYYHEVKRSKIEKTNFSPQKKRQYSLSSPVKERAVKRITYGNDEAHIIYSYDWEFDNGLWSFADPFRPDDLVIVDGKHKSWRAHTQAFLRRTKGREFDTTEYIFEVIKYVHDNIHAMAQKAGFFAGDKMVCRHFSTIALPFLSRILKHRKIPLWGTVHQISSHEVASDWTNLSSHAWNVLFLDNGVFFLDIYNKTFANISSDRSINNIVLYSTVKGKNTQVLTEDNFYYEYIRATREKYNIHNERVNSIYERQEDHNKVAKRFVQRHLMPTKLNFDIVK